RCRRGHRFGRETAQPVRPDAVDEGEEALRRSALALVEAREGDDHDRRVLLGEAADPLPDPTPPLPDAAADEDRVERALGAVAGLREVAGEADVADVVLPAGVRAPADLDRERPEPLR